MSYPLPICMIRACGEGQRMGSITEYFQKCILPVQGKPLLAHWLDAFNAQGIALPLYVVYRYKYIQVMDVIREWRSHQEKCWPMLDTMQESRYPDRIWEDLQLFWRDVAGERIILKQRRRDPRDPLLLCNGDNWGPDLAAIIHDMLSLQERLSDDVWGIVGLIGTEACSTGTEEASIGRHKITSNLWPLLDYRWGLDGAPGRYLSCAGISLFSPKAMEATVDCIDPRDAIGRLAREGKLLGWRIWQEFRDIGTPEAYRTVGAI